ncbi:MAG: acyl-CoA-binding protein [Bacteroidia bacterium]
MEPKNVFYEGKVLWAMVDANNHLRHSAYADFAAQARLEILQKLGFSPQMMKDSKLGPILFREELIYMREVAPGDTIKITCELTKVRKDGSRWSFTQNMYRGDGILAAVINVDGAWIDVEKRRLTALPHEWAIKFMEIPKSENFIEEAIPEKKTETINPDKKMTPLEEKYEAAKKRVMELPEKPSNEKMLEIYSLAKQAEIGDINIEKPAMFDFVAAAKYNSWSKKKGIAKEVAMQQYIDFVESLFKNG